MAYLDDLAMIRTRLANERTLLAWLRTALGLCAAGATWFKFVADPAEARWGLGLVAAGIAAGVWGALHARRVKRRLDGLERP